jgi:hypothetical protein
MKVADLAKINHHNWFLLHCCLRPLCLVIIIYWFFFDFLLSPLCCYLLQYIQILYTESIGIFSTCSFCFVVWSECETLSSVSSAQSHDNQHKNEMFWKYSLCTAYWVLHAIVFICNYVANMNVWNNCQFFIPLPSCFYACYWPCSLTLKNLLLKEREGPVFHS